jgi:hypothetical protein
MAQKQEAPVRFVLLSVVVLALLMMIAPAIPVANAQDDCLRVGAYIARVDQLIERATPIIRDSGNRRAVALLESAISEIRTAHRAYDAGQCRMAFSSAQAAESLVRQALRIAPGRRVE